jgi:hypothetical protein
MLDFPTSAKLFYRIKGQFVMMGSRVRVTQAAPFIWSRTARPNECQAAASVSVAAAARQSKTQHYKPLQSLWVCYPGLFFCVIIIVVAKG